MRSAGWLVWMLFALLLGTLPARAALPAVALFYGDRPPWDELRAFDVVVVDPDHPGLDPQSHQHPDSALFAYASVGEVHPSRPYFKNIPSAWLRGENPAWGSWMIDQAQPEWPNFFVEKVLAPLWNQGYRGFFLDALDSYQLFAKTPGQQARQQAGLVAVIRAIKTRWPEARLILNRGFEILPQVHEQTWMLAAESLFQSYTPRVGYGAVAAREHEWLFAQLRKAQKDFHLPVLAIDYVSPERRELARKTAATIRGLGFIPWVTSAGLDTLGVGMVEVLPRKVLMLYDPAQGEPLDEVDGQRFLGMPLAYLGMTIEFRAVTEPPPNFPATGRFAGIVSWLDSDNALNGTGWPEWLAAQAQAGLPLAVFSHFGVSGGDALLDQLGLVYEEAAPNITLKLTGQDALMGFEMPVRARPEELYPVRLRDAGKPLLTLQGPENERFNPVALTPWGGYALAPYVVDSLPGRDAGERWVLNPIAFLRAALRLDPSVPVPDVTTENGRRLFFVHIDGDGFANKAEFPGDLYAGEALRDKVLKRYPYPTTMSVIEGETGPAGLHPDLSPRLENAARDIFALPWVEIASHTYSHPFDWFKAEQYPRWEMPAAPHNPDDDLHLGIKGYVYNLQREIDGSRDYIDSRLAPPGKRTKILLWSGDCAATPTALAQVEKAGLLNMNGGDTDITHSRNSWTRIAGLGVEKGGRFQVYAPNQNENIYTNLWTGPFYGFERVIETFEMTDRPYRFKPVDLYYHSYSASKTASLLALDHIYAWIDGQALHPVFASEYIRKVLDFNRMVVARTPTGFRIRSDGELRNLRIPAPASTPDWAASRGLAGIAPAPEGSYLSLASSSADIVLATNDKAPALPYLASANAHLTAFSRTPGGLHFGLHGQVPLEFALAHAQGCQLRAGGRVVQPQHADAGLSHFRLEQHDEQALELSCRA